MNRPEDIEDLTIELHPAPKQRAVDTPLELIAKDDIASPAFTKPCARRFNWAAFGVLLVDVLLWLCLLALIAWAYDDTATYLKGNLL